MKENTMPSTDVALRPLAEVTSLLSDLKGLNRARTKQTCRTYHDTVAVGAFTILLGALNAGVYTPPELAGVAERIESLAWLPEGLSAHVATCLRRGQRDPRTLTPAVIALSAAIHALRVSAHCADAP